MILAFAGYIIMYQLYGKYIGNKIFALSGIARTPSVEFEDCKKAHNMLLQTINFCILVIAVWIAVEGLIKFFEAHEAPPQPAAATTYTR